MKHNTILILIALVMAIPSAAKAQSPGAGTILIGDTTSMSQSIYYHLPYDVHNYSYTQQLILGSELGGESMITGIDLYCSNTISTGRGVGCTIYLANTYVSKLTSGMVPFGATFEQVAVDSLVCTTGWNHYNFDTPFHYNGLGNLIIAFDSPYGGWGFDGGTFYCDFKQDMSHYFGGPLINYTSNSSGSVVHYRNVMRLHTQPAPTTAATCPAPTLRVDSVGATGVRVNWSPGYQDTSWTVEAIQDGDTAWRNSGLLWGDTTYTITGLTPNTHYTLRLTAYCTDTFTSVLHHVLTNCLPTTLPYSEGFENWSIPACWQTCEGGWTGGANTPAISSSYSHSSNRSVMLNSGSLVLPPFDAPADSLELSFWAKNGSTTSSLNLYVGIVINPVDMTTFVPIDTVAVSRYTTWNPCVVRFDNYTGVSGRIAIMSASINPYIYIDDIEVNRYSLCQTINSVSIDQVTDTSAVVHWTDSNAAVYYEVAYGPHGFTIDTSRTVSDIRTDTLRLTDLLSYTLYDVYVRPYCGSTPANWSMVRSFRTLCSPLDTLPYIEDFDAFATMTHPNNLPCWSGQVEMNTCVVNLTAGSHSGNKALRWDWSYGDRVTNQHAILPLINTTANPINTLQVSFWAQNEMNLYHRYENAKILVGVMSDPTNDSTFQLVDTVLITSDEWRRYDVPLSNYSGTGGYITLKSCPLPGNYSQWRAYIDDLKIEELRPCPNVNDMAVAGLTATSVTLRWSHTDTTTRWQTYIDTLATATPQADGTVLTSPTYTFGGLTAGTTYYAWVRALCDKGDTSEWEGPMAVMPGSWNMRPYRHDTLTACGISLYDDGGAIGNFSRQNSSLVILPPEPGNLVSVSGTIYINNISSLTIYDSIGTSGRVLWTREYEIYADTFGPIISESGPLTLVFDGSTANYGDSGFELDIACVPDTCILKRLRLDPTVPPSTNQLTITWECNGASLYQVEYGPAGLVQGTGTLDSTPNNSYTISGLRSMEHIEFYVRSICGMDDTGQWVHGNFGTLPCPDAVYRENYDSSMVPSDLVWSHIGHNAVQYSYVQTLIDSSHLAGLEGGITALAFHPSSFTEADHMSHITVYLANVADSDLSTGPILPDSGHRFVKVIDSANFYHNLTNDWQMHSFDRPFMWDGHQNLLVAVLRNDGGMGHPTSYYGHYPYGPAPNRNYFIYSYDTPINIDSANTYSGGYSSSTIGDLRLYTNTCNLPICTPPTVESVTTDFENITIHWQGSYPSYQISINPDPNSIGIVSVTGNSYTFSSLLPSTNYQIHLRQSCQEDSLGYSDWVTIDVTTDEYICEVPENITTDADYENITVTWEGTFADFQLTISPDLNGLGTVDVTGNSYTFSSLQPSTTYQIQLRQSCRGGALGYSDWVGVDATTDEFTCPAPENFTVSNLTHHTATFVWDASGADSLWQLDIWVVGERHQSIFTTTRSHHVDNLQPLTTYGAYVRAYCGSASQIAGEWSDTLFFTTLADPTEGIEHPAENSNGFTVDIAPNPAKESTTLYLKNLPPQFAGQVEVSLSDLTGRELISRQVDCDGKCNIRLNISHLPQGAYFVKIACNDEKVVRRLIINK